MATAHEVARSAGKEVERDFREKDKEEGVVLGRADGGGSRSRGVAAAFRGGDEEAQRNRIMETAKDGSRSNRCHPFAIQYGNKFSTQRICSQYRGL